MLHADVYTRMDRHCSIPLLHPKVGWKPAVHYMQTASNDCIINTFCSLLHLIPDGQEHCALPVLIPPLARTICVKQTLDRRFCVDALELFISAHPRSAVKELM